MVSECWYVLQFSGNWMGIVVDVLPPGRCYACILADVDQLLFSLWQMLLPFFLLQMLLPLFCNFLADVIAIFLLADVIAMVFIWWQMLLPLWLLFTTTGQHQPIYRHNTCLVVKHLPLYPSNVQKIAGHTNTLTPSVLDIIKNNIFFRPEEAMLETGESLS